MDDLKKAFEEVKEKGNKDKRCTRSEKKDAADNAKNEAIDAAMEEEKKGEEAEEVIDALEFAPEVDILSKFEGEWIEKTAGTKQ